MFLALYPHFRGRYRNRSVINWSGDISGSLSAEITYDVSITTANPRFIPEYSCHKYYHQWLLTRTADLYVNYISIYLPL